MSELKSPISMRQPSSRSRASSTSSLVSTDGLISHAELYYWPSIISLLTFGLVVLSSSLFGPFVRSVLTLLNTLLLLEWINLHSEKLTRKERLYFDESNILQTSKNFEFNLGPVLDETTPGGGNQCCGAYPKASVLAELFKDEREQEMQKFYREHYGNVYSTARRLEAEQQENSKKK